MSRSLEIVSSKTKSNSIYGVNDAKYYYQTQNRPTCFQFDFEITCYVLNKKIMTK